MKSQQIKIGFEDSDIKKLKIACSLVGLDMTNFVRMSTLEKANTVIKENESAITKFKKWFLREEYW